MQIEKPDNLIWETKNRRKIHLYDMENRHLRNTFAAVKTRRIGAMWSPSRRKFWLKHLLDELEVREGEDDLMHLRKDQQQVALDRHMKRMLLHGMA